MGSQDPPFLAEAAGVPVIFLVVSAILESSRAIQGNANGPFRRSAKTKARSSLPLSQQA